MKKITYTLYGLWAVGSIVLKAFGLVSWSFALSFVWIPASVALCAIVFVNSAVLIGRKLAEKEDRKIPDNCESCLFGQASELTNTKCIGCVINEGHEYGKLCDQYKRSTSTIRKNANKAI